MTPMKFYDLNFDDFRKAFEFGTSYYIEPSKNTTGRTTGEPRGLGAVLDAFTLGKLTEIGVEKILRDFNTKKFYLLDFEIKGTNLVSTEADILQVVEGNTSRDPEMFIEIKNTSAGDRWIGLTEEQFNTIKRSARGKPIYMIYASLESELRGANPKTVDLAGMFLKEIEDKNKSRIFEVFADLNAKCRVEFIISATDLANYAYAFEKGMKMYETNLFVEKKLTSFYTADGFRSDVNSCQLYNDFTSTLHLEVEKGLPPERPEIGDILVKGSFKLLSKKKKSYIECVTDVSVESDIFGRFDLEKTKIYSFNLSTLGRDPILKRNNLFISKKRVYQLIEEGKIARPEIVVKDIADNI